MSQHSSIKTRLDLFEIWLKAHIAYRQQPGVSVAIVHDQELIYAKGFNFVDLEHAKADNSASAEVKADSIFRIASHSKLFTAIAIMQLRDAGKLRLDDAVSKYLPWFNIQNSYQDAPTITIRQILMHTTGLPREAGSGYWVDYDFPTTEQIRARLGDLSTALPSETRHKYSNLAPTLAGEIVVALSGQTFEAYIEQHILQPLGMDSTSVVFPDEQKDRLVTGFGRRMPDNSRAIMPFIDARGMAAATGLSSSVLDMARFLSWQLRVRAGGEFEVLKSSTLREMQRPHWVEPSWATAFGLGFGIVHKESRDFVGHSGGYPGYITYTVISPTEKIGISVFTNALDGNPVLIAQQAIKWVAEGIKKKEVIKEEPTIPPAWQKFIGTYRTQWTDTHVFVLDDKLVSVSPTLNDPLALLFELEPKENGTFILQGKYGGRAIGEQVKFELGDEGSAQRMKVGDNWMERITYPVVCYD